MKARDSQTGTLKDVYVKALDSLPVGSEIDYSGTSQDIPAGWEQVTDPNSYSTSEVKTNKVWIDGKPIYRKVFNITSGMSTSFQIEHGISNLDYVELKGNIFSSSTSNSPIYYYSSTDYFRLFRDGNYIKIRYGSGNTVTRIVVILEYTKTTD